MDVEPRIITMLWCYMVFGKEVIEEYFLFMVLAFLLNVSVDDIRAYEVHESRSPYWLLLLFSVSCGKKTDVIRKTNEA